MIIYEKYIVQGRSVDRSYVNDLARAAGNVEPVPSAHDLQQYHMFLFGDWDM